MTRTNTRRKTSKKDTIPGLVSVPRSATTAMPEVMRTTLRYHTTYQLDAATGGIAWIKIRVNDLYDPDYAAGGHQPRFFDQLAAMYRKYCVIHSKATLEASSNQSSLPVYLVLGKFNTSSFDSTIDDITAVKETRAAQCKLLNVSANQTYGKLVEHWDISEQGLTPTEAMASQNYSAYVTATPEHTILFGGGIAAQLSSDDPTSQVVQMDVEYDVLFFNPNVVAQS